MDKQKKLLVLLLVFVLLIGGATVLYNRLGERWTPDQLAVSETQPPKENATEPVRIQMPDFVVYDAKGKQIPLTERDEELINKAGSNF